MSKTEDIKAQFEKACEDVKKFTNLNNETLLELYGLYKQACEGDCNVPKPGIFDYKGQAKWKAWNENLSMDKVTAMRRYIRKVRSFSE